MSGELDEISAAIGGLRATQESLAVGQRQTNDKLEEISRHLSGLPALAQRVDRIEPLVDAHEGARQRGRGMLIGTYLAAGSGGAGIFEGLKVLLRKGGWL